MTKEMKWTYHCEMIAPLILLLLQPRTAQCGVWENLEEALTSDILPPSDSYCINAPRSQATTFTYRYTNSSSYGQWASMSAPYEHLLFLAQMSHHDDNSNRSWSIRLGQGGNIYSYYGAAGEMVPPQYHVNAPWIDEVWQTVSVDQTLNAKAPYFIHQAGTYMDDDITTPFYSPSLTKFCSAGERQCRFASWGQQAHVPTAFTSNAIYYNRYRDCGNGVMEFTTVIHNAAQPGGDTLSYMNVPWGGVRTSTLPQLLIAPSGGGQSEVIDPILPWSDGIAQWIYNTGGYASFSQELSTNASTFFPMPCADSDGLITPCPGIGQLNLTLSSNPACRFEKSHTDNYGTYTVSCGLVQTVTLKEGCQGCSLYFINNRTDEEVLVNGVLHWAWGGTRIFYWPNVTVDVINQVFQAGDSITVRHAYFGVPRNQALALSTVFGTSLDRHRIRYGSTGGVARDYTVYTLNAMLDISPGDTYRPVQYMMLDTLTSNDQNAPQWVDRVRQDLVVRGGFSDGQAVSIYSDGKREIFGPVLSVDGCANGKLACQGSTVPNTALYPLYYITCGDQHYLGSNQYFFTPSDPDGILRPYLCTNEEPDVRANWTLLGYFEQEACRGIQDAVLVKDWCQIREEEDGWMVFIISLVIASGAVTIMATYLIYSGLRGSPPPDEDHIVKETGHL